MWVIKICVPIVFPPPCRPMWVFFPMPFHRLTMKHSICPSAARLLLVAWTCLSGVMVLSGAAAETPPILTPHFVRDVRPILSNRCFKCHGPDEEHREAGLRFDQRESATSALDSGLRAIVPAHPDDSQLIARITSTDPDLVMPPPSTMTTLSVEEKIHWRHGSPRAPSTSRTGLSSSRCDPPSPRFSRQTGQKMRSINSFWRA